MGTEEDATVTAMFSIPSVLKNPQCKMCSPISTSLCSVENQIKYGVDGDKHWSDAHSCLGIGSSASLYQRELEKY